MNLIKANLVFFSHFDSLYYYSFCYIIVANSWVIKYWYSVSTIQNQYILERIYSVICTDTDLELALVLNSTCTNHKGTFLPI